MRSAAEPPRGCRRCPRLLAHRKATARELPDAWGGAVPSWGAEDARLLIVGLAPGRLGAHSSGKPFVGDASGTALFAALHRAGLASTATPETATLHATMITNAVRCLPPQNRPLGEEVSNCRPFLSARIAALPQLRTILCLGRLAHDATLRALDTSPRTHPFAHGARHRINTLTLADSYHCSRYNMNTRRLTPQMLGAVIDRIAEDL